MMMMMIYIYTHFKIFISLSGQCIYTYIYKRDLVLDNLQGLICHKT